MSIMPSKEIPEGLTKAHYKSQSNAQFIQGIKFGLPVLLGYMPLAMAFGVLAKGTGLSTAQVVAMSVLVYSGSAQFIAVGMLGAGVAAAGIITTILLVNSRMLLLSASLAPFLKKLPVPFLALASHGITDETYAVALGHLGKHKASRPFLAGLFITAHLSWVAGSFIGAVLGNLVGDIARYGLDFALTAMFICLLVMQLKNRATVLVALLAGALSVLTKTMPIGNWNIILATVLAATTGVILIKWKKQLS